jgi:adenylylsulfate kinase-like enzyme
VSRRTLWAYTRLSLDYARSHLAEAFAYGPHDREFRAREMAHVVRCLVEAQEWREKAKEGRK